jgi:predicted exporter
MKGKFRWLLLIPLLAVVLGVYRLRFDIEVLNLLPTGEPVVEGLKLFQEYFANARELIITVRGKDAESAEAAAKFLAERFRKETNLVAEATWEPPWLEHPEQSSELIGYLWLNQSPAAFGELTNRLSATNITVLLQDARERLASSFSPDDIARLSYDPFGLTRLPESVTSSAASFGKGQELFASPDGKFRMLFVEAQEDLSTYRACDKWLEKIKKIVESRETQDAIPPGTRIKYTGRPAFVAEIGGGMERDMGAPSAGTLAVIALLFYITHRRWRPLLWLIVLLIFILATALALGGLIYGTLNVVSLGFASILLGLAEDFGIVLYQESRTHPELSLSAIRKLALPGIFWSSITTCGAFLLLNLSGLPGLGQLGTLVAVGIAVSAIVMLYLYLPPLMPRNSTKDSVTQEQMHDPPSPDPDMELENRGDRFSTMAWSLTILVLLAGVSFISLKPPRFDRSPDSLRPKNSQAYAALDELKTEMRHTQEPLWVVVEGRAEVDVQARLEKVEAILAREVAAGTISGFTTPASLWPHVANQEANRQIAASLIDRRESYHHQAEAAGFAGNSLGFADGVLQTWQRALATTNVFWPTNENSHWILEKLTARAPNEWLAVALIHPQTNLTARAITTLARDVRGEGIWLSGWDLLGPTISNLVIREIPRVVIPILIVVLCSLWLAFRSVREVLLSLATLVVAGLCLEIIMSVLGWTWNMMNLMSIPLLLGMGVDFAIHMQLALRRYGGNLPFVRNSIGKALLLAGSTTVAGFASVAFSSNAGLASLGKVCATGISCAMLTAVFLLPAWWKLSRGSK